MYENLLSHILTNPAVNGGRATVRDTHITVAEILDRFASGLTTSDILGDYPPLSHLGVQAALAYAAHVVRQADEKAVAAAPAASTSEDLSSSEGT